MSEFSTRWDVYRDSDGNPVTVDCAYGNFTGDLTDEQLLAVRHAAKVWREVVADAATLAGPTGYLQTEGTLGPNGENLWHQANMAKSRLLLRMIHQGLPPHDLPPPLSCAGGWWKLVEDGKCYLGPHNCSGKAYDEKVSIEGHLWPVVGEVADGLILRLPFYDEPWLLRKVPVEEALEYEATFQPNTFKYDGLGYLEIKRY